MTEGATTKWYKSKGVITGIVTVIIGVYSLVDTALGPQLGFDLPQIPEWIFILLGSLGIYSRVNTTGTITK